MGIDERKEQNQLVVRSESLMRVVSVRISTFLSHQRSQVPQACRTRLIAIVFIQVGRRDDRVRWEAVIVDVNMPGLYDSPNV